MAIQLSNSRRGVAKDQLIFIIICSVALAVAAVTLVHFFTGGGKKAPASEWQCLDCGDTFTVKKAYTPPLTCKCGGEAVRLGFRLCSGCDKKVLAYRIRMPDVPEGAGPGGMPGMMMGPTDMQFRIKLEDDSYGWSEWMSSSSPEFMQMYSNLACPECGEIMSDVGGRR